MKSSKKDALSALIDAKILILKQYQDEVKDSDEDVFEIVFHDHPLHELGYTLEADTPDKMSKKLKTCNEILSNRVFKEKLKRMT